MEQKRKITHIALIDRPSIRALIHIIFSFLKVNNVSEVLVAELVGPKWLISVLNAFCPVRLIKYDLGDFTSEDGVHLFSERERLLHETYVHLRSHVPNWSLTLGESYERLATQMDLFMSRYVLHHHASQFARILLLREVAAIYSEDTKLSVIFERPPVDISFKDINAQITLISYFFPRIFVHDVLNIIRSFKIILFSQFQHFHAPDLTSSDLKAKIGISYVQGVEDRGYGTDWDWINETQLSLNDCVYFLNEEKLKDHGDPKALDIFCQSNPNLCVDEKKFTNINFKIGQDIVPAGLEVAKRVCFRSGFSFRNQIKAISMYFFYEYIFRKWQSIFYYYNIRVYINVADSNLDALPVSYALETLGGVDLSFEFSATGYHAYFDARPLPILQYLCWGEISEKMINSCEKKLSYAIKPENIVYAGNMKLYLQHANLNKKLELKIKNAKERKGNIIVVLDAATTHLKFFSVQRYRSFYDAILILMRARPNDLFIIKPQRDLNLDERQNNELERLIREQHVFVAPALGLPHFLFLHSDLVITTPVYSSAFFETLASGGMALCYDDILWPHILDKFLPDFCRANNSASMQEKVEMILDVGLTEQQKDQVMALQRMIDPYGDGQGHKRFAFYIECWLSHIRTYGDAKVALKYVLHSYNERWPLGKNKEKRVRA
ncbi:MAG: hypothetical protein L6Q57_06490 [Alphaproteobacteria bacterium]|nr:hypothetical protein [Alphaproteobacteria bacterium]